MRDRQLEATLAFLSKHEVLITRGLVGNQITVTWSQGGHEHSISSRPGGVPKSPDELIVQIPEIKARWENAELNDRIENSGTDRT